MKKNFLFGLIGAGALILSGSVGFAAWTIKNSSDSKEDTSLKITADAEVKDQRISVTALNWDQKSINFAPSKINSNGQPVSYSNTWLEADGYESSNLTTTCTVTGTAPDGVKLSVIPTLTETTNVYTPLIGDGIVGKIPTPTVSLGNDTVTDSQFSATITIKFTWGSAFGGDNPYVFYNKTEYDADKAEEARDNILKLAQLKSCKFNLKVDVSLASN